MTEVCICLIQREKSQESGTVEDRGKKKWDYRLPEEGGRKGYLQRERGVREEGTVLKELLERGAMIVGG